MCCRRHWRGGSADDQSDGSDDDMHSTQPPTRVPSVASGPKLSSTPLIHTPSPSIYAQHRLAAPPQFPTVSQQYPHQPPPQSNPQQPAQHLQARRERGICYDFQRGICARGGSCRFAHDDGGNVGGRRGVVGTGPGALIVPGPPPGPPPPLGRSTTGPNRFQRDPATSQHQSKLQSMSGKRARSGESLFVLAARIYCLVCVCVHMMPVWARNLSSC